MQSEELLKSILITGDGCMVGSYVDFGIKTDRNFLDITNLEQVLEVFKKEQPKVILHLAAETDLKKCEENPQHCYFVNSVGTYNVAVASKEINAKMIYISTNAVFDGIKKTPYKEGDEPNPQNYYGRSKFLGELVVKGILENYLIVRTCWIFGGGKEKDKKFVGKIIEQLKNPETKEIKAVINQIGSPTFAKDLVNEIKKLIIEDKKGIIHISNNGIASRYEIAKFIVEKLKSEIKVLSVDSSVFNATAKNESLTSENYKLRNWQEALEEYLKTEWKII
mgnify:FL=1